MSADQPISSSGTDESVSKKRTRGPYTGKSLKKRFGLDDSGSTTEGDCILQFDDNGVVIGPDSKTRTSFSNYIGRVCKAQIHDFVTDWRHIDSGLKETLWEDIKVRLV